MMYEFNNNGYHCFSSFESPTPFVIQSKIRLCKTCTDGANRCKQLKIKNYNINKILFFLIRQIFVSTKTMVRISTKITC